MVRVLYKVFKKMKFYSIIKDFQPSNYYVDSNAANEAISDPDQSINLKVCILYYVIIGISF